MLTSHIRATMGEVMTGAEQLKGLAQTLDGFCDLAAAQADAEEMRQVAVGIRATAIHALLTAANVAGLSERLNSVAAVLEAVIPPDSKPRRTTTSLRDWSGRARRPPGPPCFLDKIPTYIHICWYNVCDGQGRTFSRSDLPQARWCPAHV
ncbi:MAG TPA: hypothetical protein VJN18_00515 [Polyangiaceae bacterium]|nr:hypothetical protein [Polyangiaceae bacterium]